MAPADVTLWFNDGDVILTIKEQKIRIHREKISQFSSEIITSSTRQSNTEDEVDAFIIDEDPLPFIMLIRTMYNQDLLLYFEKMKRSTMVTISSMFELSSKYAIHGLDIEGKVHPVIKRDWPSSIAEWDANEALVDKLAAELGPQDPTASDYNPLDSLLPEPASVLRYAHSLFTPCASRTPNRSSYAAVAFYHISRLPPLVDPDEYSFDFEWMETGGRTVKTEWLSRRDLKCLWVGKATLQMCIADIAFEGFRKRVRSLRDIPAAEKQVMMAWWLNVGLEGLFGAEHRDPIRELKTLIDALDAPVSQNNSREDDISLHRTGSGFRASMRDYLRKERKDLWVCLPDIFDCGLFDNA